MGHYHIIKLTTPTDSVKIRMIIETDWYTSFLCEVMTVVATKASIPAWGASDCPETQEKVQ